MKVKINEDECIGCGYCEGVCEEVYNLEDGVSHVIVDNVPDELIDSATEAMEGCPTGAIKEINQQ